MQNKLNEATYKAIAAHWNGACYSSDGEEFTDYDTLEAAIEAAEALVEFYDTDADGEPCDVDLEWHIYDEDDNLVKAITVDSQAAEREQDSCEVIASEEREYVTEYVGVNEDGKLVKWVRNGGSRGAHQGDQNRGCRDTASTPEEIDAIEWLKLAVDFGLDDASDLPDCIDVEELQNDADSDQSHYLDAAGQCWSLPVYSIDLGRGKRLAWSNTDEAGVDDIAIIDHEDWAGFAESIAESIGDVVDIESGEHFTAHGVQYQHQAPGEYDQEGFRRVIVRRDR